MIAELDSGLTNVEKTLTTAQAMADALEYYLIEGEIYRTVMTPATHGYTRITMSAGELLTLLHDLHAQRDQLPEEQRQQVDEVQHKVTSLTQRLTNRYYQLLEREIIARLDSLNWFLNDCQNNMAPCREQYPSEIRNRQRIEELLQAWGEALPRRVSERVERIDERVRQLTEPAPFIWPDEQKARFPQDPYWYLYELPVADA
jgi:exonuclease VII large subunit